MKAPKTMGATQEEWKYIIITFPSRAEDCYWLVLEI